LPQGTEALSDEPLVSLKKTKIKSLCISINKPLSFYSILSRMVNGENKGL
jgi:hypothetical protein